MFKVHRTYISKLMITLMACFPRVVDWIIPPLPFFHPSLIGFDILTLCPVTMHSLLYTYILLHWCSTDVKLVHWLTLVNGILAQSNKSISFKYAWVVWVLFSYSYHFPWEKHVQDAASTRRRDTWSGAIPTDMQSHEQDEFIIPWNVQEKMTDIPIKQIK